MRYKKTWDTVFLTQKLILEWLEWTLSIGKLRSVASKLSAMTSLVLTWVKSEYKKHRNMISSQDFAQIERWRNCGKKCKDTAASSCSWCSQRAGVFSIMRWKLTNKFIIWGQMFCVLWCSQRARVYSTMRLKLTSISWSCSREAEP